MTPACRLCHSVGNAKVGICGADIKMQEIYPAFEDATRFSEMLVAGKLVMFPGDPANNSTRYVRNCTSGNATADGGRTAAFVG